MGTLQNQAERNQKRVNKNDIIDFINELKSISEETKLPIEQVISVVQVKELERKNNLFVSNGDIFDEQMKGIGDYLSSLVSFIENDSDCLENKQTTY